MSLLRYHNAIVRRSTPIKPRPLDLPVPSPAYARRARHDKVVSADSIRCAGTDPVGGINGKLDHKLPNCLHCLHGGNAAAPRNQNTIGSLRMALKIERFQPEGMNVRKSGGQPSYSHVVTVSGTGKIVYTAGQLARDIDGNCVGKGDMRAQMEQTFQNLDRCLKAAGATWADVVKTNTFVTDFDEFQKCGDVRMRYLGVATPTSTTVGVTRLAGPDFMIEIEAVAVVNS
jgi:2-iminobutanoate/2-iminopropanoate deaminase